jgi:cytochrome oxidase Cu insertion factor (SCO1/SenC/PrrC family)
MSVHSLPEPNLTTLPPSGHGKLLAMLVACSLPVLLAIFVFFVIKPTGEASFGQLIHPARPMPAVSLMNDKGQSVELAQLKGQWLLVTVDSGACDAACSQHLFIQRQLREMLNKDKDRVDRIWLIAGDEPINAELQPLLVDTTVLRAPAQVLQAWLGDMPLADSTQNLFVVDPQGHAMLRMPADMNGKQASAAKNMLQKLLMASAVWDKPGR